MKKLIESRYFWLLTALLGAVFLPLLTMITYTIMFLLPRSLPKPLKWAIYDALERTDGTYVSIGSIPVPEDLLAMVVWSQTPAGLILGLCSGAGLSLWRQGERRFSLLAKKLTICGASFVILEFGWIISNIWRNAGFYGFLFAIPFVGYPLLFALVLFLWGLHLPNPKPESQDESESSP